MELIKFELKFATTKLNPQIQLNSKIFLLPRQSYLEYKLLGVGIPSRYSEYLLMVKKVGIKRVGKKWNWLLELINLELELNWN